MSAEQQLREVLTDPTPLITDPAPVAVSRYVLLEALVGRLLDPIPYKPVNEKGVRHHRDCLHDLPGVTICDCDRGDVEAYRAWLIGGEKPQ